MSTSSYTEFNLPRNAYAAFDALSIKQLIINRLKTSGLFDDVDYEGSNINGLVDVIAYTYHVLLFYLNQTASDSTFSQAELFENMNKIVSLIGYKPNGNNTSSLNIKVSADGSLTSGKSYTIPRFSNIVIRNIPYSFNTDITFQKNISNQTEYIESIGANNLLYQGIFKQYPTYTAMGENFEQFTINISYPIELTTVKMVDQNNIFVFVYDINTNKWKEWKEISNLYLATNISEVFEKHITENANYTIKFGNNINGKRLNQGDLVSIYYLESDGALGVVGTNVANEGSLAKYTNSGLFSEIFEDIKDVNASYLTTNEIVTLKFDNEYSSIPPTYIETVDEIRKNAPLLFSAQNRAVTLYDYTALIEKNFSNILQSVQVCSNKEYTTKYLSYFYDLGLERPNMNDRLLFNQVSFNDACDFNNVYLFCVPRLGAISNETTPIELFSTQKQSIINKLNDYKMINQNIVMAEPIYLAFDIGLPIVGETITSSIREETILRINRSRNELISKDQIKSTAIKLITDFFAQSNNKLGQVLDFAELSFNILDITGVDSIETVRKVDNKEYKTSKLNFIYWNPLYKTSEVFSTAQNLSLEFFQYPFFYEISKLVNKIEVV
jgi:hypothetical protein